MQYTSHYNLNLPEGTDIVNPLVQDNPNYSAIDAAMYANKLRVIGTATHVKTGTNHAITLGDSDINQFKFVATGDYATGDTFTVDGVTVTPRIADGSTIPNGAFKINSTVLCILDGTILNITNIAGNPVVDPSDIILSNGESVEAALVKGSVSVTADGVKTFGQLIGDLTALVDFSKLNANSKLSIVYASYTSVFAAVRISGDGAHFAITDYGSSSTITYQTIRLGDSSNAKFVGGTLQAGSTSVSNSTSTVPASGTVLEISY